MEMDLSAPNDLADVVLLVEGKRFYTSAYMLSAISPVLKDLISRVRNPGVACELALRDRTSEEVEALLKWTLHDLPAPDGFLMTRMAKEFGISALVTDCVLHLLNSCDTPSRACRALCLAQEFGIECVMDVAKEYFIRMDEIEFRKFLDNNEFDQIQPKINREIITKRMDRRIQAEFLARSTMITDRTDYGSNVYDFTPTQRQVLTVIKSCVADEGVSISLIDQRLPQSQEEIRRTIDFLAGEGHIYSTVDDQHYRATDVISFSSEYRHTRRDGLTDTQQQVVMVIKSCVADEGASINFITQKLAPQISQEQIRRTIDFLAGEGYIYSTLDDQHYMATDAIMDPEDRQTRQDGLTDTQQQVLLEIKLARGNAGVEYIAQKRQDISLEQIRAAAEHLLIEGHIFYANDGQHFKATDDFV